MKRILVYGGGNEAIIRSETPCTQWSLQTPNNDCMWVSIMLRQTISIPTLSDSKINPQPTTGTFMISCRNMYTDRFISEGHAALGHVNLRTSANPCKTRIKTNKDQCDLAATGRKKLRMHVVNIATPNILQHNVSELIVNVRPTSRRGYLVADNRDARNPAGICVKIYPQKNAPCARPWVSGLQSKSGSCG